MDGKRPENPFATYSVVSQVAFMVVTPLLLFIWGGSWLIQQFDLPGQLMILFVILGILTMVTSVGTYLMKLCRRYDNKPDKHSKLKHDPRDHDF